MKNPVANKRTSTLVSRSDYVSSAQKTEDSESLPQRLPLEDETPRPLLPRSAWNDQLAKFRAVLQAKQALDREEKGSV